MIMRDNNHREPGDMRFFMQHPGPAAVALRLHRLRAVRRQERISLRCAARRLNIPLAEARREECESSDLPLSALRRWAEALDVPVAELVQEPEESLSLPLLKRARLLRIMKTAMTILQGADEVHIKRLAQQMVGQLTEMMPELRDVAPWRGVSRRRGIDVYGIAYERRLAARISCEDEETP